MSVGRRGCSYNLYYVTLPLGIRFFGMSFCFAGTWAYCKKHDGKYGAEGLGLAGGGLLTFYPFYFHGMLACMKDIGYNYTLDCNFVNNLIAPFCY